MQNSKPYKIISLNHKFIKSPFPYSIHYPHNINNNLVCVGTLTTACAKIRKVEYAHAGPKLTS